MTERKGSTVENRWWVDQGKLKDKPKDHERQAPAGSVFFHAVRDYDQEKARDNLTDLNLKLLTHSDPSSDGWAYIPMTEERCPPQELERIKEALALPAYARAVAVDSGRWIRVIVTGSPVGERILEFNFGDEPSFDCWIGGDWVQEELFRDRDEALRKAGQYLRQYLGA